MYLHISMVFKVYKCIILSKCSYCACFMDFYAWLLYLVVLYYLNHIYTYYECRFWLLRHISSFKENFGLLFPKLGESSWSRTRCYSFQAFIVLSILRHYWCKGNLSLLVLSIVLDDDWDKSRLLYSFLKKKLTLIIKVLNFLHYFYDFTCIIMLRVWKQPLRGQYTILHLSGTLGSWQTL